MALYHLSSESLKQLEQTTFELAGIRERADLQRVLRANIEAIAPDCLVISEEFGEWSDSRRRIDLLALDRDANLVVVELKRIEDGGHMELQALRYAAMVSTMTFEKAVELFARFRSHQDGEVGAREALLQFLRWTDPDEDKFAQDVRIVLASSDFGRELTSAVMWLNDHEVDIRCVRMRPYVFGQDIVLDIQQIIPLPEAAEFQVQIREKARQERAVQVGYRDFTKYDLELPGRTLQRLNKRNLVLQIVKFAIESGAGPDEIAEATKLTRERLWRDAPGNLNALEFIEAVETQVVHGGRSFDSRRYFCSDDELVHYKQHTYALSNQWGGKDATDVVDSLIARYGNGQAVYRAADS
jgi:hypothetical protein